MNATFELDRPARELRDGRGCRFDPLTRNWTADQSGPRSHVVERVDALTAVAWLQRESQHPLRVPIGVIGPRDATTRQLNAALEVGELLAHCGLVVICGGREGVMQAVCEGVKRRGGMSIGLLPDTEPAPANTFVSVILATGIGEARNALIARAAFSLIAIGDSYGTLSEVALGRQFGKLVVGLEGAARLEGVEHVTHARTAIERVALAVLGVGPVV
jgi:uncharacterized protein (TIGR00725 family)